MMQCRDIDELMVDFLYQELDAARMAEFEAHVQGCARCGAEIGSLQRTREALRSLPEVEPSPALSARLLHEASKRSPKAAGEGGGLFGWLGKLFQPVAAHPAWAAMASLVVVVALSTVLLKGKVASHVEEAVPDERDTAHAIGLAPPAGAPSAAAEPAPPPAPAPATPMAEPPGDKPRDVRGLETPPVEVGGKVAAKPNVVGPPASRERAEAKVASGRIADKAEGVPLDALKESPELRRSKSGVDPSSEASRGAALAKGKKDVSADGYAAPPREDADSSPSSSKQHVAKAPAKPRAPSGGAPVVASTPAAPPPPPQAMPQPRDAAKEDEGQSAQAAKPENKPAKDEAPAAAPPEPSQGAPERAGQAQSAGEGGNDRKAAEKAPAPLPEEQLFRQAQKDAAGGACSSALALSGKIAKMNPEFYRRRVAGDPTIDSCTTQRKAKKAAPAAAPRTLDQENNAEVKSAK